MRSDGKREEAGDRRREGRVVVVGSCNTDLVMKVKRLPKPGETVGGGEFEVFGGGKGANQAVAAARAGGEVTFVGCVGQDDFGELALARLRAEGIGLGFVVRSPDRTSGVALIFVGAEGENLIGLAPGANEALSASDVDRALPEIRRAGCLVVQLEVPLAAVRRAVRCASGHGVPVLLNPAPAQSLPPALLHQVTFLTPNELELERLSGRVVRGASGVEREAGRLSACGPLHVIVTCGARGVCWAHRGKTRWFPAPRVRAIDTVGAGDCFCGALATAVCDGSTVEEAIRFAVAAASLSVTRRGAQAAMPSREEILRAWRAGVGSKGKAGRVSS